VSKIRLTKNELKHQKEGLQRFQRYLPMLQLKKKQLQVEIIKIHQAIQELAQRSENLRSQVISWVDVFGEDIPLQDLISVKNIKTKEGNTAGVDTPVFGAVSFDEKPYDFLIMPLWVDKALRVIKETITLKAQILIYRKQLDILKEELRITNQRVNLFEKVKIPQAQEYIRAIRIYLGELRTAEVVRGKIAKAKIEKRKTAHINSIDYRLSTMDYLP